MPTSLRIERAHALIAVMVAGLAAGGCARRSAAPRPVRVLAAASLDQVLADLTDHLRKGEGVPIETEISGSQEAARKVSEYGVRADVLVVADYRVIDWILGGTYARWTVRFATNEVVIGYSEKSRYADEITGENWPEVLLRPGVTVARADENLAPVGYQTLMCWQLAQRRYADLVQGHDLTAELLARTTDDLVRPSVISLVPLLGTRADYAFIYRSVAHGHNVPYVRLAPEVNFADPAHAEDYAGAEVTLAQPERTIQGAPIVYGVTIPTNAPNPEGGVRFLQTLLGPEGRRTLEDNGFNVLPKPLCDRPDRLPEALRPTVETPPPEALP